MKSLLFPLALSAIVAVTIWIVRYRSEAVREGLSEKDRRYSIGWLSLLAVIAPLPVMAFLIKFVTEFSPTFRVMPDETRAKWILFIATLGSMAGLPFGIKLLRRIREDGTAGFISIVLSGYGICVWLVLYIILASMFMKSCC